jgi:hypothetical protein
LDFRREGLSPSLSLLMSAFSLPMPPAHLAMHLHWPTERSATTSEDRNQGSVSEVRYQGSEVRELIPDT